MYLGQVHDSTGQAPAFVAFLLPRVGLFGAKRMAGLKLASEKEKTKHTKKTQNKRASTMTTARRGSSLPPVFPGEMTGARLLVWVHAVALRTAEIPVKI